jgi:hypothetical protein
MPMSKRCEQTRDLRPTGWGMLQNDECCRLQRQRRVDRTAASEEHDVFGKTSRPGTSQEPFGVTEAGVQFRL